MADTTQPQQQLLTPDEIRWAANQARNQNGPSDATSPQQYVLAGANALLAKLREQQPVGWQVRLRGDRREPWGSWHDCSEGEALGYCGPGRSNGWHYEYRTLYAAPVPAQAVPWRPISEAPQDGRKLVLSYVNRSGKRRTVFGRWLTDEQAAETDGDDVGLTAGWYECIDNWDDFTHVAIHEGEPDFFQPLPAAPHGEGER